MVSNPAARSNSRAFSKDHFGRRRQWIGIFCVGLGLATFFIPLIDTNPAVMGNLHWSLLDLLRRFGLATLLQNAGDFVVSAAIIYALLSAALTAIVAFPSQKLLARIGVTGAGITYLAFRFTRDDLERMLYGSLQDIRIPRFGIAVTGRGVSISQLMLLLLGVMLFLIFLSLTPALDETS